MPDFPNSAHFNYDWFFCLILNYALFPVQFYDWATGDDTGCVLVLTADEHDRLVAERGAHIRIVDTDEL